MALSCGRMIDYFASTFARECGWLDVDDIRNDAWEEAMKAQKSWLPDGGCKFTTYLYRRLQWYRLRTLRDHSREMVAMGVYRRDTVADDHQEPEEMSLKAMVDQAQIGLDADGQRVLMLLVDPPVEFHDFVRGRWSECSRVPRDHCLVRNSHFAKYLGIHYKKVDRIVERIETAIRRLLHGH